jgi:bifunctional non-homologous end joining protein LigD
MPESSDKLIAYRSKRAVERSPEPAGSVTARGTSVFVVHKHAARQLHFDLRLEMDGVLESWAVPKGPSRDPREKRLAVKVEDHPIEYAEFEGVIPEGNYGAGPMIVWDRGVWVPLNDIAEGFEQGKLLFELRGYKLRGTWTLVKIKKSEREWLLIKERHMLAAEGEDAFPQDSILSGLTVEQLGEGQRPGRALIPQLEDLGGTRRRLALTEVAPMLAETGDVPFSRAGWLFELKYDGYRLLAGVAGREATLVTRSGRNVTRAFPEIARALRHLPVDHLVVDGEVVVHDERGVPSFQRLQQRGRLRRPLEIQLASVERPATLYLFDLLALDEFDLRPVGLTGRKQILRDLLPTVGPLRYADHIETEGAAFFAEVRKLGLEGIVAKRGDAPYRAGRSSHWIKFRVERTDDFVVVGYTAPKGSRSGFGALHLAAFDGDDLVYCGRVGSGFTEEQLTRARDEVVAHARATPPCRGVPDGPDDGWVEPVRVCEVRYREVTADGVLRQPVFVRFRDDKPPSDCLVPNAGDGEMPASAGVVQSARIQDLQLTNTDKIFWPADGYTKGDLLAYYRAIAPWILPYLRDRPLVMTRYPDGIEGKSFFQKDAPDFAPEWIRTERVWSEGSDRELRYFVCDDEASLLYVANLGSIPLHVWASRVGSLERPDWCILDLDPSDAPFASVIEVARALHILCGSVGLPSFVKTSGSSGLHVLIPLGGRVTHEQARLLGEVLARIVVQRRPDVATVARLPTQREDKVYVDYLQNGHGKLLAAPLCVRPRPGAPVSMPLRWSEVTPGLAIGDFTIRNAADRLATLEADPMRGVLDTAVDLAAVLGRLQHEQGAP